MKITEIEYQGDRATLTLDGEQKLDIYQDFRIPIDRKKSYRVLSVDVNEDTGKLKIILGIYRKDRQMTCRPVGVLEFLEILDEHKLI